MAKENLSEEIKPKIWIAKNIFFSDALFITAYTFGLYMFFSNYFKGIYTWIFILFSVAVGIWIISKCPFNPVRRNYQELILYMTKNREKYRPVIKSDFRNHDNKNEYMNKDLKLKRKEKPKKKILELLPKIKYDYSNDAFIMSTASGLKYMDILRIIPKDWVNATNDDIQIDYLLWDKFYKIYPGEIKIITMRFRCHTYVQQQHILKRMEIVKNQLLRGELERKLEELKILEKENYERNFFLMFFADNDMEFRKRRYTILTTLGSNNIETSDYQTKKDILFKLNNKNSRML